MGQKQVHHTYYMQYATMYNSEKIKPFALVGVEIVLSEDIRQLSSQSVGWSVNQPVSRSVNRSLVPDK